MDGRAGLLVQSGLLADPVEDLPVQRAVVIQEGLQLQKEACDKDVLANTVLEGLQMFQLSPRIIYVLLIQFV